MDWVSNTNRYKKALVCVHLIQLSNVYPATFIEDKTRLQISLDYYHKFHVYGVSSLCRVFPVFAPGPAELTLAFIGPLMF